MIEVDTGKNVFSGAWNPGLRDETALLQRAWVVVQMVDCVIEDFSRELWVRHCGFRPEGEGSVFGAGFKTSASPPFQSSPRSIKGAFSTISPVSWSPANRELEGCLTRYSLARPTILAWLDLGYAVSMMLSHSTAGCTTTQSKRGNPITGGSATGQGICEVASVITTEDRLYLNEI